MEEPRYIGQNKTRLDYQRGLSVHNLGYMNKRNIGDRKVLEKTFDGPCSLRERMPYPDRMSISLRILFQLIKPEKDGRFITDGIEEHVPAVGCQVQFPGSLECLGIA